MSLIFDPHLVQQRLGRGLKRIGPDGEYCILALFMLAQLRADARQQHCKAEWLGDIIVGPGFESEDRVRIAVVPRQHHHRTSIPVLSQ